MQQHQLVQGSPNWHAHRANYFNASDAPAMMGCSPYKTRSQLLHERHTGTTAEVDAATQQIFDNGHRFEALARPLAESIIGSELYPVVGTEGRLSASFDGLTMLDDVAYEHKSLNDALRAAMVEGCSGADLPLLYQVQMEQQCMVAGCQRVLFMATKWKGEELVEERHCWYTANPDLAAKIDAGWDQFDADLCAYVPEALKAEVVGFSPASLPALRIEVTGKVVSSNLEGFKTHALDTISKIKTDLKTDQDFADADRAVKWCEEVESRTKAAKELALGKTESIDALFRLLDEIGDTARTTRLNLEKKVKAEKENRKNDAISDAQTELDTFVTKLNERLGTSWVPRQAGGFAEAARGKKSIATIKDACATTLANAKIAATALADRLEANRKVLKTEEQDFFFLFADFATVGAKPAEDFKAIADLRIRTHKDEEAARKARAAAAAAPAPEAAAAPAIVRSTFRSVPRVETELPTLKLGTINERLDGISVTADLLTKLGFPPTAAGSSKLYRASDYERICRAVSAHALKAIDIREGVPA